jgi:hypothetical protein
LPFILLMDGVGVSSQYNEARGPPDERSPG